MGCGGSKSAEPGDKYAVPDNKNDNSGASRAATPEDKANLAFLSKVELFKRLPKEQMPQLAKACEPVDFASGSQIIKQGDTGSEFFVIKEGAATVKQDDKEVATLKAGDYFGEQALLRDDRRNASIIAKDPIKALKITREQFRSQGLHEKLEFAKRGAVAGGAATDAEIKPPSSKTPDEINKIIKALKDNTNLSAMLEIDDASCRKMADMMWKENVRKNEKVITEGDLNADYFYVINEGAFDISKKQEGEKSADESINRRGSLGTLEKGSFGELALLYFAPRAATITATVDGSLFVLARQQFKEVFQNAQKNAAGAYIQYLDTVEILNSLKANEKQKLAEALTECSFSKDEEIFKQGEKGDKFYMLIEGEVGVFINNQQNSKLKFDDKQKKAPFFGERALLTSAARAATIKVLSETAKCLAVDKTSFDMLLGSLEELQNRGKDGNKEVAVKAKKTEIDKSRFGQIERKDLKRLGLLGCGGFGAVEMVENVKTGDVYALKALSKGYVLKTGMQKSVMSEKDVQLMCDSDFIVKLYETFNGEQSLYFLLELCVGGELYATYNKKGFWGKEKNAKFYVAGTVFAFDHLHERKIVYRDLKPENLLLNEKGQVKLTDMGLAKVVIGKTFTTCGTPDYFAPELIASKGHGEAVDWWTLGILNYELLAGHPPFEAAAPMQIYQKVTKGIGKVTFAKACKGTVETLIKGNLHANPTERLPMKKGGSQNIKNHEWYKGFDWKAMEGMTMEAPYVPATKSKKDMANFSARKEDMPPQVPYKDPKNGWDKDFATSK